MKKNNKVFQRIEQKYFLSENDFKEIILKCGDYIEKDPYYFSTISSIYFDSPNNDIIINCLEKPIYKDKYRLRYYGVPKTDDMVFLESKKKYDGVVNKRRIELSLDEVNNFIKTRKLNKDSQIAKEIEYGFNYYNLEPKIYIAYDRYSFYEKSNDKFRITFDTNLRYRYDDLKLSLGDHGKVVFDDKYIMETKALNSLPYWFCNILSEMNLKPISYSKFGEIYKEEMNKNV